MHFLIFFLFISVLLPSAHSQVIESVDTDVMIISASGGHASVTRNLERKLTAKGLSVAVVDHSLLSRISDYDFESYVKKLRTFHESENDAYLQQLAGWAEEESLIPLNLGRSPDPLIAEGILKRYLSVLDLVRPKIIISTIFHALSHLQFVGRFGLIPGVATAWIVTDYSNHPVFTRLAAASVDQVFSPSRFFTEASIAFGKSPENIVTTGIPTNPAVFQELSRSEVSDLRNSLGLKEGIPTVFLAGGSGGILNYDGILHNLAEKFKNMRLQVVVAVGTDAELAKDLARTSRQLPQSLKVCLLTGFRSDLPGLFRYLADAVITKAGGLTTTELAISGVIPILMRPAFYQEEKNRRFFVENGLALTATTESVGEVLFQILKQPSKAQAIQERQRAFTKGMSIDPIVNWALKTVDDVSAGRRVPQVNAQGLRYPKWLDIVPSGDLTKPLYSMESPDRELVIENILTHADSAEDLRTVYYLLKKWITRRDRFRGAFVTRVAKRLLANASKITSRANVITVVQKQRFLKRAEFFSLVNHLIYPFSPEVALRLARVFWVHEDPEYLEKFRPGIAKVLSCESPLL